MAEARSAGAHVELEGDRVESLVIHAASLESAEGFCAGLSEFDPKLTEAEPGRYEVEIPLRGSDRAIVAVLNALEKYVTHRSNGPARIEVYGRRYTMHAADGPRRAGWKQPAGAEPAYEPNPA